MKQNFEGYLMEYFCKVEPTVLDDDIPDAFNDWLEGIDIDTIFKVADSFGRLKFLEGKLEGEQKIIDSVINSFKV